LCAEELEYDREAAPILAQIDAAIAAGGAVKEPPSPDTQPAADQAAGGAAAAAAAAGAGGGKEQLGGSAAAGPEAAAAQKTAAAAAAAGSDDDVEMVDSELLSDLDTEDGTAEEVKAADMAAFREIRLHQKSTHMLMSRDAFTRVAQDVLQQQGGGEYSFDCGAVNALQRACESYLVDAFETSNLCAINSERQKVQLKDMQLAAHLTGKWRNKGGQHGA
jgi:histone H3/H4